MKNNKMVSFDYLIKECFGENDVYIPLIQRNYKWSTELASKLAADLWSAFLSKQETYTVGMITLYREADSIMQLVDGQQRIITLYLLLKYLKPNEECFSFRFERDEGVKEPVVKRQSYLNNIALWEIPEEKMYTDLSRFKENYKAMTTVLELTKESQTESGGYRAYKPEDADEFIEYIRNNVYFLLHISGTQPFDEFINLNKNKTRFVISDRIKANLIMDSKEDKQRKKMLHLFEELSEMLFLKKDVWKLVQQGYCEKRVPEKDEKRKKDKHYTDENRLKLLCCERYGSDEYDVSSTLGYEYGKELSHLNHYRDILAALSCDISTKNWNSYNAFSCLYKLKNGRSGEQESKNEFRFFGMLKNNDKKYVEEYLWKECSELSEPFEQACFIESQLKNEPDPLKYIDKLMNIREEFNRETDKAKQQYWLDNGAEEFDIFRQIYSAYIEGKYNN
ncbi:hypothetical protein QW71_05910 [Paenibacillus sp. IHB B 3415]|uniref:DUF262 domain-containing protein n=1 Tax=Paenibacillus sp. IHB B 3415 TaxID=867080 RepID=UPI000573B470|nr:DUF262 domain-containing protein [Paenibacillus sp. IHB B 3415]KHL96624.1 hypothetical protein QW71_05910 [Paenibacillus sp. IHB B 3415]